MLAGLLLGVVTMSLVGRGRRARRARHAPEPAVAGARSAQAMAADRMLALLPTAAVLIDAADSVRMANGAAVAMGIVKAQRLDVADLTTLVRTARRTGESQVLEFVIDRGG